MPIVEAERLEVLIESGASRLCLEQVEYNLRRAMAVAIREAQQACRTVSSPVQSG
ncbi:hypothetical protein KEM63_11820 [Halopseudomonas nanhaiensis]|uniref:hypothetical protein n=1 Tax=Halopseudomonas nanhaiensis TaxID=2830842 RepID=UPI001CC09308|nr:hypothetical protein [Halopseudomonas nanhaiensis]UAW97494.1 hypothetical protein KEM63_11820 [Halopseudomonas nanhaiensis]